MRGCPRRVPSRVRSSNWYGKLDLVSDGFNRCRVGGPGSAASACSARGAAAPRRQNMRAIVKAMLYVLRGGLSWRLLPHDVPKGKTAYDYCWKWRRAGPWEE